MPCLRMHLLLEFQRGRAMHRGRVPARGPGGKAAQGLCPHHTAGGLPLPAPGMRPGTEIVLNKNLLRERRQGERGVQIDEQES